MRVWSVREERAMHTLNTHSAAVSDISLHATGDYVLSASHDKKWAFSDLRAGRTLCAVADDNDQRMCRKLRFL